MSTLNFKNVVRKGPKTGDIVEYSAEEKVPPALQRAASASEDFKNDYLVTVGDVKILNLNFAPKGELLKKMWQHNIYSAEGSAVFRLRHLRKDMMLKPTVRTFKIKFEDSLDHLGLPDLKIIELKVD